MVGHANLLVHSNKIYFLKVVRTVLVRANIKCNPRTVGTRSHYVLNKNTLFLHPSRTHNTTFSHIFFQCEVRTLQQLRVQCNFKTMNQSRATRRFCDRHTAERSLKRFRSSDTSEKIAILNKTGILNMQDGRDDEAERCIAQALGHADDKFSGVDISTSSESL
jgi:hypothetical protein